jgi:DNA segregation ATPase FtsK/SpoIIIE-like protein
MGSSTNSKENVMAITTVIEVRRNLLRGALTLLGIGERAAPAGARPTREDALLTQAAGLVEARLRQHGELVVGPISLLQREYDLGYGAALELAARLEAAQVWSVYRDASGMRCARKAGRA